MATARLLRQLEAVDWDFPVGLPGTASGVHWYPGTFPAALPTTLIQAFSKSNDLVFDPYAGVGTTALEALRQGRRAIAVEKNPVAILAIATAASLVVLKSVKPGLEEYVLDNIEHVLGLGNDSTQGSLPLTHGHLLESTSNAIRDSLSPQIPLILNESIIGQPKWESLRVWIESSTLKEIRRLYDELIGNTDPDIFRLTGLTMLSAIVRPASSQTQSWGHIADNVQPKAMVKKSAKSLCFNWLRRVRGMLRETHVVPHSESNGFRVEVCHHDWLSDAPPRTHIREKPCLLITSPPYANAIDYSTAQRLSFYFFGYSDEGIAAAVSTEIGARRKRFSSDSEEIWSTHLMMALENQLLLMDNDPVICVLLPHKNAGREFGSEAIQVVLKEHGFQVEFEIDRSIRQSRTRQSWTSIKRETLRVYRK